MNSNGEKLLKKIDSDYVGLIWVSKLNLAEQDDYFTALDYLFNGLLTQQYKLTEGQSFDQKLSFYSTKSFDYPFFLGIIKYDEHKLKNDLESIVKLTSPLNDHKNQIFILSEENSIRRKTLEMASKNYKQFRFN